MLQDTYLQAKDPWGAIPPAPKGYTWEGLMQKALFYAKKGAEAGEVPVGALVVSKQGKILSYAHNESVSLSDPSAHAEILALRRAAQLLQNYRLLDCYLVVTLEPCLMCTGAIREARLAGLVFGVHDERAGSICSCLEGLDAPHLGLDTWHLGGILAHDCKQVLQEFFENKR